MPTRLTVRRRWPWPDLAAALPGHTFEGSTVTEEVRARYDTAGGTLAAAGATLEHLSVEFGDAPWREVWSLHLPAVEGAAAAQVWDGPAGEPPAEAMRLLAGLSRGCPLVEVGREVATRHTHRVVDARGHLAATVVDTTDDTGGGRRRLVEVVAAPGRRREARRLSRALRRHGASPAPAAVRPGPAVPAATGTAVSDVAGSAIGAGLARLLAHDPHLRAGGPVEAVHQARVATRRLRSDLRTLADVLDVEATGHLREELRWLGARLGAVRDADVLEARLLERAAAAGPGLPGVADLVAAVRQQRHDAMAELSVTLGSPRYLALLDDLAAAAADPPRRRSRPVQPVPPATPGWARRPPAAKPGAPARRALPALLRRPWRALRSEVRGLPSVPADADLHRVRILAKELRYAAEVATPVLGRRAARLAAAAKDLQGVLGDHHDAVVAEAWLRGQAAGARAEVAFAAGVLVADERAEQARLRSSWRDRWDALDDVDHRWLRR